MLSLVRRSVCVRRSTGQPTSSFQDPALYVLYIISFCITLSGRHLIRISYFIDPILKSQGKNTRIGAQRGEPLTTNLPIPTFESDVSSKKLMQHQYLSHSIGPLAQQGQTMNHSSGPNSGGGGEVPWGAPFPSLHLWPIQDTFQMKMIHLPEGQRVSFESSTTSFPVAADVVGKADGWE